MRLYARSRGPVRVGAGISMDDATGAALLAVGLIIVIVACAVWDPLITLAILLTLCALWGWVWLLLRWRRRR